MAFWTDIAGDMNGSSGARALHVTTGQGDLFVLVECNESGLPAGAAVVQEALAALVGCVACSSAKSPFRALDLAFLHANRAVYQAGIANPAGRELLVSACAVYCADGAVHFASVGANAIYLRERGTTVSVVVPETEGNRLVTEGITVDPLPGFGGTACVSPSNGLGLPPDVFKVHQTGTYRASEDYLVVLCGGRAAQYTTAAHVQTLSPGGEDARTANRLYHQVRRKAGAGTAVLAAHKALDFQPADISHPFVDEVRRGGTSYLWAAVGAILIAVVAVYLLVVSGDGGGSQGRSVLPPTRLLPPKSQSGGAPREAPAGPPLTDVNFQSDVPEADASNPSSGSAEF